VSDRLRRHQAQGILQQRQDADLPSSTVADADAEMTVLHDLRMHQIARSRASLCDALLSMIARRHFSQG
jgi:hypothetical protein